MTSILVPRHSPSEFKLKTTRISLQVLGSLMDHAYMFKGLHLFLLLFIRKMVAKLGSSQKHKTFNSEYDIYEIIRAFPKPDNLKKTFLVYT